MSNNVKWVWLITLGSVFLMQAKELPMNFYGIVLAGGSGERLWPLSRRNKPKQFLSVDSQKNLLDEAIDRLSLCLPPENILILASHNHKSHTSHYSDRYQLLVEPSSRNTGPAILNACFQMLKKDPNAIVIFVPADQYVPKTDYHLFAQYVEQAVNFAANNNKIALLGVKPSYPATGYGYIEYDQEKVINGLYEVKRFHEKPSEKLASFYTQMPHMLWNICMFAARASVFVDEFSHVAPELYQEVLAWHKGDISYDEISNISIDYAVLERSNQVFVLPVDFGWCDVGNLDVFLTTKQKLQELNFSTVLLDSSNNVVDVPDKLIALVGVHDLCIVDTPDVLLIAKRTEAEKVRSIVNFLKKTNQTEYL